LEQRKIKVSVIVPVYNQEELLKRCLDSIPVRDDVEAVIVDDGSTDSTPGIIGDFMSETKLKVSLVTHPRNLGLPKACNDGTELCRGEYIYYLDSDDYLYTENFVKAMDFLDGTDLVFIDAMMDGQRILRQEGNSLCAAWFKFIRREYLGDYRREDVPCGSDRLLNDYLMSRPHTERQTGLLAYHYTFPRKGSLTWINTNSRS